MLYKTLPLYFFPTTIVVLDDDKAFLDALSFGLDRKFFSLVKFNDIERFVKYMKDNVIEQSDKFVHRGFEEKYDNIGLNVDVNYIHRKLYEEDRHKVITVVIVDYNLGSQSGVNVLREMQGDFRKILLTGIADEKIAVQAMNHEYINFYIKKQDANLIENLNTQIAYSQARYFTHKGRRFIDQLNNIQYTNTLLGNKEYIELFNNIIKSNKIIEGYLLDSTGSYLFFDSKKTNYCLLVSTEEQMDANQDIIPFGEYTLGEQSKLRKKLLMYYPKQNLFKSANIFPVKRVITDNRIAFYYSFVKNEFKLDNENIKFL